MLNLFLSNFSNVLSPLRHFLAAFPQHQLSPRVRYVLFSGCFARNWSFSLLHKGQRNLKVYLYIPELSLYETQWRALYWGQE